MMSDTPPKIVFKIENAYSEFFLGIVHKDGIYKCFEKEGGIVYSTEATARTMMAQLLALNPSYIIHLRPYQLVPVDFSVLDRDKRDMNIPNEKMNAEELVQFSSLIERANSSTTYVLFRLDEEIGNRMDEKGWVKKIRSNKNQCDMFKITSMGLGVYYASEGKQVLTRQDLLQKFENGEE